MRADGCDKAQGYYYSKPYNKPLPAAQICNLLRRGKQAAAEPALPCST